MRFHFSSQSADTPHAQSQSPSPARDMDTALVRAGQEGSRPASAVVMPQRQEQYLRQISGFLRFGEGGEAAAYYVGLQLAESEGAASGGAVVPHEPSRVSAASRQEQSFAPVQAEAEHVDGFPTFETVRLADLMIPLEERTFSAEQLRREPILPLSPVAAEENASLPLSAGSGSESPVSAASVSKVVPVKGVRKRTAKTGILGGVRSRKNAKLDLSTLTMFNILGSPGHLARATRKEVSDWVILQAKQPLQERHDFLMKVTEFNDKRLHHNLYHALNQGEGREFVQGNDPALVKAMDTMVSKLDTARLDESIGIQKATEYITYFNNSGADIISDWLLLRSQSSAADKITLLNKVLTVSGTRTKKKMAAALQQEWSRPFLKADNPDDEARLKGIAGDLISGYGSIR